VVDFLFYGTLMDRDVLRLVVGRPVAPRARRRALLPGYWRRAVRGEAYPGVVPAAGAQTEGLLIGGLSLKEAARVSRFENTEYEVRLCEAVPLDASGGALPGRLAWVYVATPGLPLTAGDWSYARWRRRDKWRYLNGIRGWLNGCGRGAELLAQEAAWRRRLDAMARG
jgi:hypothetical protein